MQMRPIAMIRKTTMAMAALLLLLPPAMTGHVGAADVFRWVDEQGRTHYGNVVPKEYESLTKPVRGGIEATPEQRRNAELQAERERAALAERESQLRGNRASDPPAARSPAASTRPVAGNVSPAAVCDADWRAYRASEACFARYKVVGGGLKSEAFQACRQLARPACNEPGIATGGSPVSGFAPPESSVRTSVSPGR
jgi:hypothetical protein